MQLRTPGFTFLYEGDDLLKQALLFPDITAMRNAHGDADGKLYTLWYVDFLLVKDLALAPDSGTTWSKSDF